VWDDHIDGSASSERALDVLTRLPLLANSLVSVVYVTPVTQMEEPVSWLSHLDAAGLAGEQRAERGVTPESVVRHDEQLNAVAQGTGDDLVVVGSANRTSLGRLFLGSVSGRVLSHAPCAVLVARTAPGRDPERGDQNEGDVPA
jgi:nucleotide-binding universal stress UspA family protein